MGHDKTKSIKSNISIAWIQNDCGEIELNVLTEILKWLISYTLKGLGLKIIIVFATSICLLHKRDGQQR